MSDYSDNKIIKKTVSRLNKENDERYTYMIADVLMNRMYEGGISPTPMNGDSISVYEDSKGRKWLPLFTDEEETSKGTLSSDIKPVEMKRILKEGLDNPEVKGVLINPFGESRKLDKGTIEMIFMVYKKEFDKK